MKLIINKDRSVSSAGTWGTVNENDYEILDFEFPAELEEYNKRIVYYLGDERVWDTIVNNKAYITNAITTKGDVKAYVWCTKENTEREADTDFRTQLFEMNFYENENADGIVPTEEQVDGFNTMLTAMNEKIEEIDELETTIENAETQRQENEETRQNNEDTRQENEQTRQEQEAERERRTDEAIGEIEDLTEAYNQNAQQKTEAFNNNATQKTGAFNSNAESKTSTFNTNATNKTNDFNSNASSKTTAFNENATSKTNTFNSNVNDKTSAFNDNATQKTTNFDNNASSKTTTFNENATSKTNYFNDNATEKTTAFNENAQDKIDEYDEHIADYQAQIDELQEEVEELSENMPWNTTEQATEIQVTDAAKYSRNKLELFGNTEQTQYTGVQLLDMSDAVNGYFADDAGNANNSTGGFHTQEYIDVKNNTSIYGRFEALDNIRIGRFFIQEYNENKESIKRHSIGIYDSVFTLGQVRKLHINLSEGTKYIRLSNYGLQKLEEESYVGQYPTKDNWNDLVKATISFTDVDIYEPYVGGAPSPSPDYPQDIHVVTGENDIYWTSNENKLDLNKNYIKGGINSNTGAINTTANPTITLGNNSISVYTPSAWNGYISDYYDCQSKDIIQLNFVASTNYFWVAIAEYDLNKQYIKATPISNTSLREINIKTTNETKYLRLIFEGSRSGYSIDFTNINFVIQNHVILDLGSIELCKIGDYQDYLYKENGNWYKYGITSKIVFNGSENWRLYSSERPGRFYIQNFFGGTYPPTESFCDKFSQENYTNYANIQNNHYSIQKPNQTIWFVHTDTETLAEWKEWLSNNNVLLRYLKANPESKATVVQITDETLIAQLDAIYEHLQLVKGTNNITVTASDLAPYMELSYMQDLKSKLDNLDSRLALLE